MCSRVVNGGPANAPAAHSANRAAKGSYAVNPGNGDNDKLTSRLLDRRSAIAKAAVAGGIVWAAPVVLSQERAFATGSACGATQTMVWPANSATSPPGNNTAATTFTGWQAFNNPGPGNSIRVLVDFTTGSGVNRRGQNIAQLGNVPAANNFQVNKNGAALNADCTVTLRFVDPVTGLAKSVGGLDILLLDIDKSCGSSSNFTDQVIVAAENRGNVRTPTTTTLVGASVTGAYPTFTGFSDAAGSTATGGNVRLQFTGKFVTQISFTYRSLQAFNCAGAGNPCNCATTIATGIQYWGINNFQFC